jgi:hypothetical protein
MDEVYTRLTPDVKGEELEQYVFNKAKEMLKDIYGIEVKWGWWHPVRISLSWVIVAPWRITVVRLLRWIPFSILVVALTSLVFFLVLVWLRIILLAVF